MGGRGVRFFKGKTEQQPRKKSFKFVVTTGGDVVPYAMLKFHEITKTDVNGFSAHKTAISKDSDQQPEQADLTTADKLASKPYNPELFLFMYNNSIHFRACVDQIASDVAGIGYVVKQIEEKPESAEQEDKASAFLEKPNPEYPIEDLWQMFLIDRNLYGYAGIEVVRNLENEVAELWHMNAGRIWRHKKKQTGLFAEKRAGAIQEYKWFLQFNKRNDRGDLLQANKDTGEFGEYEFKDRAHEIIYRKLYYPGSSYYGAPPITPGSGDVVMAISARDYNLSFFVNFGIPAMIVMLSGEWTDDTEPDEESIVQIIKRELKELQGAKKAHNTIVVGVPHDCELKIEKLNVEVKEGSFKLIRQQVAEDILIAHRMPPYRIAWAKTGSLAGNVAYPMLKAYISAVVEPLQLMIERLMNDLFRLGMGIENYELKLNDLKLWDEKEKAEINAQLIRTGQATPNEVRREDGKAEFIGGDSFFMESSLIDIGDDVTE
jgi:HK97 family phage portal protein